MNQSEEHKKSELNTSNYYKKYYQAWSRYMFWFFFIVLINVVFIVCYSRFYPYMSESIRSIMAIITPIILVLSIMYSLLWSADIRQRNQKNFDEYTWEFRDTNPTITKHVPQYIIGDEVVSSTKDLTMIQKAISKCGATNELNNLCGNGKKFDKDTLECVTESFTSMDFSYLHMN